MSEERHQVLEHRPAPGEERGHAVHAGDGAAQPEPVQLGQVALGDGDEARQPGLGGEQVVVGRRRAARAPRRPRRGTRSRAAGAAGRRGSGSPSRRRRRTRAAGERRRARRRRRQLPEPLGERDERTREVAAVHRRDVAGLRAAPGSPCRTSCRGAPRGAPAPPCVVSAASTRSSELPGLDEAEVVGGQRPRAVPCRCWSARSGAPPSDRAPPGSCRAAGRGPPAPMKVVEVAPGPAGHREEEGPVRRRRARAGRADGSGRGR